MSSPASSSLSQQRRWHSYKTAAELSQAAAEAILDVARQAIAFRGAFHIVLAGGNSPRKVYEILRHANTDWPAWHVYFGDERCLPPEHEERNSLMAAQAWLSHAGIPPAQIHLMPAELGAETAAGLYTQLMRTTGEFDLVLLGLGEDAHTASLFPGHEWGTSPDAPDALAVHNSPKPPADRVTLSANRLGKARYVMFLVTGESKRQAVKNWRDNLPVPASSIIPENGVDVFIEANLLDAPSDQP